MNRCADCLMMLLLPMLAGSCASPVSARHADSGNVACRYDEAQVQQYETDLRNAAAKLEVIDETGAYPPQQGATIEVSRQSSSQEGCDVGYSEYRVRAVVVQRENFTLTTDSGPVFSVGDPIPERFTVRVVRFSPDAFSFAPVAKAATTVTHFVFNPNGARHMKYTLTVGNTSSQKLVLDYVIVQYQGKALNVDLEPDRVILPEQQMQLGPFDLTDYDARLAMRRRRSLQEWCGADEELGFGIGIVQAGEEGYVKGSAKLKELAMISGRRVAELCEQQVPESMPVATEQPNAEAIPMPSQ